MLLNLSSIHEGTRYRIKDREKALILQSICGRAYNTRKTIAVQMRLRPSTVSKRVQELLEDRLIYEGEVKNPGRQGRPEICLFPNFARLVAAALYVVSRELNGVLLNLNEKSFKQISVPIPREADSLFMARRMTDIIEQLIGEVPPGSELVGIGASLPGTVNPKEKLWISAARWPRMKNLDFKQFEPGTRLSIQKSLDTELEYLLLKNPEYRQGGTLLFHWGYGIGSAYAHNGIVLRSNLGRFGEVGHWEVSTGSSKRCTCGQSGCLETEAALWSLLASIKQLYSQAPEDEIAFGQFIKQVNIQSLPSVARAGQFIHQALSNLYKTFYSDRILLLGPFTEIEPIFGELCRRFKESLPDYAKQAVKLECIRDGFRGQSLGSVYPFFRDALRTFLKAR